MAYTFTPEIVGIGGFIIALSSWGAVLLLSGRRWRRYGIFVLWALIVLTVLLSAVGFAGYGVPVGASLALLGAAAAALVGAGALGCGLVKVHKAEMGADIWKALLLWVLGIGLLGTARYALMRHEPMKQPVKAVLNAATEQKGTVRF